MKKVCFKKNNQICQYYEFMLDRQINKVDITIRALNEMKVIIFKVPKDKYKNYICPQLYYKFILYLSKNEKQI